MLTGDNDFTMPGKNPQNDGKDDASLLKFHRTTSVERAVPFYFTVYILSSQTTENGGGGGVSSSIFWSGFFSFYFIFYSVFYPLVSWCIHPWTVATIVLPLTFIVAFSFSPSPTAMGRIKKLHVNMSG